jgi:hypothetical protein
MGRNICQEIFLHILGPAHERGLHSFQARYFCRLNYLNIIIWANPDAQNTGFERHAQVTHLDSSIETLILTKCIGPMRLLLAAVTWSNNTLSLAEHILLK